VAAAGGEGRVGWQGAHLGARRAAGREQQLAMREGRGARRVARAQSAYDAARDGARAHEPHAVYRARRSSLRGLLRLARGSPDASVSLPTRPDTGAVHRPPPTHSGCIPTQCGLTRSRCCTVRGKRGCRGAQWIESTQLLRRPAHPHDWDCDKGVTTVVPGIGASCGRACSSPCRSRVRGVDPLRMSRQQRASG
jgi:hypothetical protein